MKYYNELLKYMDQIEIIDTHEHLPNESERINMHVDFSTMFSHYCKNDLAAAGMSTKDLDVFLGDYPVETKWKLFSPYYERIKDGSYARCARSSMKQFYDYNDISSYEDAEIISNKIQSANKIGLYKKVLKDTCKIKIGINFNGTGVDREFFIPVSFVTNLADINMPQHIMDMENICNFSLTSLSRYIDAIEQFLNQQYDLGMKGVKFHFAYMRSLNFDNVCTADAEKLYSRIYDEGQGWRTYVLGYKEAKPLQDYIVHRILEIVEKLDIPVVFHVGFQANEYAKLSDTRPENLWSILQRYRKIKFNILHGGIPWMNEVAIMAKHFPNLYIDMGWTHAMSPELSIRAIKTYIDMVPNNKIFGYGGDYCIVEKVFGHLQLAKSNIAIALSDKIEEKTLSEKRAYVWIDNILYNNPSNFYQLDI